MFVWGSVVSLALCGGPAWSSIAFGFLCHSDCAIPGGAGGGWSVPWVSMCGIVKVGLFLIKTDLPVVPETFL